MVPPDPLDHPARGKLYVLSNVSTKTIELFPICSMYLVEQAPLQGPKLPGLP
jgi:hypothetical protein